ncbi:unnamed protein product [Rotaria sp. Silwood2]|nr:unnamed protein product [Rotaria sp. Silwood2]
MLRPSTHHLINTTTLILQTDDNLSLVKVLPYLRLPHLQSLALVNESLVTQLLTKAVFESIRSLTIDTIVMKSHAEQMCIVFPQLELLQIRINDQDTISLLIDGLKYLSISLFVYCQATSLQSLTHEWFVQNSLRLTTNNNFTCRVKNDKIHLWMTSTELHLKPLKQIYMDWMYEKYLRNIELEAVEALYREQSSHVACGIRYPPPQYPIRPAGKHHIVHIGDFKQHPNESETMSIELSVDVDRTALELISLLEKASQFQTEWRQS